MQIERELRGAALVLTAATGLFACVAAKWPDPVSQIDIPLGKVERLPGTQIKAIFSHGQRDGVGVWYVVPGVYNTETDSKR